MPSRDSVIVNIAYLLPRRPRAAGRQTKRGIMRGGRNQRPISHHEEEYLWQK